jgi:hypothetical protein
MRSLMPRVSRRWKHWLDDIQHGEADEFEEKLVGLVLTCNPIIGKVSEQQ